MEYRIANYDCVLNADMLSHFNVEILETFNTSLKDPLFGINLLDEYRGLYTTAYQTLNDKTYGDMLFLLTYVQRQEQPNPPETILRTYVLNKNETPRIIPRMNHVLIILYENKNDLLKLKLSL